MTNEHTGNGMTPVEEREDKYAPRAAHCYADDYRVFRIEDGESHWCVEMLADEALKSLGVESLGYKSVDEYCEDMGPVKCEPVYWSDEITVKYDDGTSKTKRAREWAIEHRGVFCSTVW